MKHLMPDNPEWAAAVDFAFANGVPSHIAPHEWGCRVSELAEIEYFPQESIPDWAHRIAEATKTRYSFWLGAPE